MNSTDNLSAQIDIDIQGEPEVTEGSEEHDWNTLIERYQPIINAVCRHYRLKPEDAADVSQTVWLKAVTNLNRIRETRALPGWIKTTARRTACDVLRSRNRLTVFDDPPQGDSFSWSLPVAGDSNDVDNQMLRAERRAAVRQGLAELTEDHRVLLTLLVADPPISYQQISDHLGLPLGSIGPTRARCLRKLAANTSIQALASASGV